MTGPSPLTKEEKKAIKQLQNLAKTWPESLWLYAGGSVLGIYIMKLGDDGHRAHLPNDGVDPAYVVGEAGIPCDGGDW